MEATLVTHSDREGDACRSPVATAREAKPVACGHRQGGVVGHPWRPRGWRARSPEATVRAASQRSPCGARYNLRRAGPGCCVLS
ncbi:hypothetical protein F2Q69_00042891 [Brassica cretica]|uniref:Uncharacterized protein n=1 Tax=Brassica cretica TaxID=69181 RepID=A0A8S9NV55_BRACR|nr:hypothetical protein F2Q69_00042891 [Brassica cretica]